jgi:non-heme Fe2+,alpha-ketoglutarate-dependent halogenase
MALGCDTETLMQKYQEKYNALSLKGKLITWLSVGRYLFLLSLLRLFAMLRLVNKPEIKDFSDETPDINFGYRAGEGADYLNDEEIRAFHKNGFLTPFKVMEREEALALNAQLKDEIMKGNIVYGAYPELEGEERKKALEKAGQREDLESRGWNRHYNIPAMMKLMSRPEITKRLASLLGEDVYLWRSQTFPKSQKSAGTALHQVTDFSASTSGRELVPNKEIPASLINLTAWVALTDTDEDNSALVYVRSSHYDNRFEQYTMNIPYYLAHSALSTQYKMSFLRSVHNDPSARFDIVQLYCNEVVNKLSPGIIDNAKVVTMKMKAGEAIIFTSRCIHGSHHNSGERERFAIGGRYTSAHVDIYPDDIEYREINHFLPLKPVLAKKYLKGTLVHSVEDEVTPVSELNV